MGRLWRVVLAGLTASVILVSGCASSAGTITPGGKIFSSGVGHAGPISRSIASGAYVTEGLPCGGCHGPAGKGTGLAPPITRSVLGTKHSITHMPVPGSPPPSAVTEGPWTTVQTVETARTGVTPEGNRLGGRMPRWRLDDQDAAALAEYLGTL